jgi:F-type H+-transporting ATPase subunit delta
MRETRVAKRYAAALFEIAKRDEIVDAIGEDLALIERLLRESATLRTMFTQPLMTDDRKVQMVTQVFGDRITATSLNFLKLLIRKRRADIINETVEEFRTLLLNHLNIVDATAQTAVPMNADQLDRLTKSLATLTGKKVNLTAEVDPDLIGGVVVRIGDDIIDGSLRGRLHRLEQHLLGARTLGGSI